MNDVLLTSGVNGLSVEAMGDNLAAIPELRETLTEVGKMLKITEMLVVFTYLNAMSNRMKETQFIS